MTEESSPIFTIKQFWTGRARLARMATNLLEGQADILSIAFLSQAQGFFAGRENSLDAKLRSTSPVCKGSKRHLFSIFFATSCALVSAHKSNLLMDMDGSGNNLLAYCLAARLQGEAGLYVRQGDYLFSCCNKGPLSLAPCRCVHDNQQILFHTAAVRRRGLSQ